MTASTDPWLAAQVCTWPEPWQTWVGGEYPSRRSTLPPLRGWVCSGCGRGYSPSMMVCSQCGQHERTVTTPGANESPAVVSRRLGPGDPLDDEDYER